MVYKKVPSINVKYCKLSTNALLMCNRFAAIRMLCKKFVSGERFIHLDRNDNKDEVPRLRSK